MSAPQYVRNQSQNSTFESLFPLLDCSEIYVGTLHYDFLDPPPTGTTRWAIGVNPNDIYNINGGNVGVGTNNPSQKLSVAGNISSTGNIIASGNITCNQLNYTTLNPPISAGGTGFWMINDDNSGIYYSEKVAINTTDFPQPEDLYVNGDARIVSNIDVPSITGLVAIVSPSAGSINDTFDNYTKVFSTTVGTGFFFGGGVGITRNLYVSRVGQFMSISMAGAVQNTKPSVGKITTTNIIPDTLFPFGLPRGQFLCKVMNDNSSQAFNANGSIIFKNFNGNVQLEISASPFGDPFVIPLIFGNFYGYADISFTFSIYAGNDAPIGGEPRGYIE